MKRGRRRQGPKGEKEWGKEGVKGGDVERGGG